ncbi:hypothetical protein BDZ97DRAFT_1149571 [Flammula alnicola]|nr:hypothetical protein BDZ97DRAFT_1149571 [Flammula alnicola]
MLRGRSLSPAGLLSLAPSLAPSGLIQTIVNGDNASLSCIARLGNGQEGFKEQKLHLQSEDIKATEDIYRRFEKGL